MVGAIGKDVAHPTPLKRKWSRGDATTPRSVGPKHMENPQTNQRSDRTARPLKHCRTVEEAKEVEMTVEVVAMAVATVEVEVSGLPASGRRRHSWRGAGLPVES